jgi:hypothetical protein
MLSNTCQVQAIAKSLQLSWSPSAKDTKMIYINAELKK